MNREGLRARPLLCFPDGATPKLLLMLPTRKVILIIHIAEDVSECNEH